MDYKVLRQNDKISLDIDPEKPKIDSEDVRKKEKHSPHEDPNCAQFENEFTENSLEAVSLERRSTILEGKSKYHNFCKFKEKWILKWNSEANTIQTKFRSIVYLRKETI